eukprot:SAG22_NODE_1176_length_5248_cov_3.965819_1_plen_34_part_10
MVGIVLLHRHPQADGASGHYSRAMLAPLVSHLNG